MKKLLPLLTCLALACGATTPPPPPAYDPNAIHTVIAGTANAAFTQTALFVTPNPTATLTPVITSTPTATWTPLPTWTNEPIIPVGAYGKYKIEYLQARMYGGGELTVVQEVTQQKNYTTYLAKYPSDGLNIYALIRTPNDTQRRAVIVTLHGYSPSGLYDLYDDNNYIDEKFVAEGFIVVHPTMRNYPPSDSGDNLFRVGQSVDVLNLLASIKAQSGQPGPLEYADGENIGAFGFSTGGGVILRMLTVNHDLKAAALYSSISGDERHNVPLFQRITDDAQFAGEVGVGDAVLAGISPASYYAYVTAPVLLLHGERDSTIPLRLAKETCEQLTAAQVQTTCTYYSNSSHSFWGPDRTDMLALAVNFFDTYLR